MPFAPSEIEDGSGTQGAIVYSTIGDPLGEALSFLVRRGLVKLSGLATVAEQEAALIKGVEYVESAYGERLHGRRKQAEQSLYQPRFGQKRDGEHVDTDGLPIEWLRAGWYAAERSAGGELLDYVADESGGVIAKGYGKGALATRWSSQAPATTEVKKYREIENVLRPLLGGGFTYRMG